MDPPTALAILLAAGGLCVAYVLANEVAKVGWRRVRGWNAI